MFEGDTKNAMVYFTRKTIQLFVCLIAYMYIMYYIRFSTLEADVCIAVGSGIFKFKKTMKYVS